MKYNKTRKAFFLDRDGVIIKDVGYLTKSNNLALKDTLKTLKLINKKNYLIIIITNQSVVGRN